MKMNDSNILGIIADLTRVGGLEIKRVESHEPMVISWAVVLDPVESSHVPGIGRVTTHKRPFQTNFKFHHPGDAGPLPIDEVNVEERIFECLLMLHNKFCVAEKVTHE